MVASLSALTLTALPSTLALLEDLRSDRADACSLVANVLGAGGLRPRARWLCGALRAIPPIYTPRDRHDVSVASRSHRGHIAVTSRLQLSPVQ